MFKWIRRIVVWALVLATTVGGGLAAAYYSGVVLPLYEDLTPATFPNWNRTARIDAQVEHDSRLARRDGRMHFFVDLQLPEAAERLQAFLDGGRTEVVACGPQKLFLHSLKEGEVGIDGDLVRVRGLVDMELDGPVSLRDRWPMSSALKFGHDRTTVWADVVSLSVADVPQPMIDALLKGYSHFGYTRDQIFETVAKSLEPGDAALLATHRDALDMAFEDVRPALLGEVLVLEAVVSVDEGAAFRMIAERLFAAAGEQAAGAAALLAPAEAYAQLKLDDLGKPLEDVGKDILEGPARGILEDVTRGGGAEALLDDPKKALEAVLRGLPDCKVSF